MDSDVVVMIDCAYLHSSCSSAPELSTFCSNTVHSMENMVQAPACSKPLLKGMNTKKQVIRLYRLKG